MCNVCPYPHFDKRGGVTSVLINTQDCEEHGRRRGKADKTLLLQQCVPMHLSALTHHFNEGREEQKNWIREITLTPPHMRSGPKWGKNGNILY